MLRLSVPDMSCGHCKGAVEKAITGVDPLAEVSVDLSSRTVSINSDAEAARLLTALEAAGYPASQTG